MESLNLNTLASSLPTGQQNAEKELLNNFKAAALSITTLYRSSRKNAKKAYNAGYAQACQDMLNFIQQGVSASSTLGFPDESQAGPSSAVDGGGMTIGRVMDFTEARLDAIKALEEDEDEDEEKEAAKQAKSKAGPSAAVGVASAGAVASTSGASKSGAGDTKPLSRPSSKTMSTSTSSLPTPSSPVTHVSSTRSHRQLQQPSSPSPPPSGPPSRFARPTVSASQLRAAGAKQKSASSTLSSNPKGDGPTQTNLDFPPSSNFDFFADPPMPSTASIQFPDSQVPLEAQTPMVIGAGSKRRHAMMMMLDSPTSGSSATSSPSNVVPTGTGGLPHTGTGHHRRRTRSSRNLAAQGQSQSLTNGDDMDVEEEGRERKRVARR
ncbi:hypothetical protein BKA70DRAFT_1341530 [Coprinopsis sp. MPI-PUGE-AT-0042]|nr:hypothetical protein BKA70DRAFT_1341530 [Coprinopsis sp. MPI-PUGE-AT-0042]